MKITDIEAIACVWPPPENHFWTSFRPIGRVSELNVEFEQTSGENFRFLAGLLGEQLTHFLPRDVAVGSHTLAGDEQQPTDRAELTAHTGDNLQKSILFGVYFGFDHLLGLDHGLFCRTVDFYRRSLQRFGVLLEFFLLQKVADHQPEECQRGECTFQEVAEFISG